LAQAGSRRVAAWDWSILATQVLRVYEIAIAATPGRVHEAGDN
jgi:phosphatidylinositol alpha-mannosyltransferase